MTSIRWCAVAVALGSAAAGWGQSQFWGELKAGKYAVGFRSLYQLDVARSYDADYPPMGSPPVKKPRPIFLAVWYPAAAQHNTSMLYRDYFLAVSVDSPVPEFAQRLRRFLVAYGVSEGNPNLRVGSHLKLVGLGPRFDNTYYTSATAHRFDTTRGYETEFTAECAYLGGAS